MIQGEVVVCLDLAGYEPTTDIPQLALRNLLKTISRTVSSLRQRTERRHL